MNLGEISRQLGLMNLTPELLPGQFNVTAGFVSDLLSDVLANAPAGGILVTVQLHMNVVAVALHAELSAIIFAAGRRCEEAVRAKAIEERICLLATDMSAFEVVGRLYELGVRGRGV